MKKLLALTLSLLLVLGLMTGCGASAGDSEMNGYDMEMPQGAADGDMLEESGQLLDNSTPQQTNLPEGRKLIIRMGMDVETEDLPTLLTAILEKTAELGGYAEHQSIENGSAYEDYRWRSARLTLRIPADRLPEFVSQMEKSANVVSKTQTQEDVTLQYVATESRLKALQTEEARLLELLEQAENLSEILEIEARLTDVRYELEAAASQMRVMDNQVDYATVELSVRQVTAYTPTREQTAWEKISTGFMENLRNIGDFLVDAGIWILVYLPQLLLTAAVITGLVLLHKRRKRRKKARRQAEEKPEEEP